MQVCWAQVVKDSVGAPPTAMLTKQQNGFVGLAWLPGWPIAMVMDYQGRCAAVSCAAEPLGIRVHAGQEGSQVFQNMAFERLQDHTISYNAWRSFHLPSPRRW